MINTKGDKKLQKALQKKFLSLFSEHRGKKKKVLKAHKTRA